MPKAAGILSSTPIVMLATEHDDLGLCPRQSAVVRARDLAKELRTAIYIRDPTSDEVIFKITATGLLSD
jgi:hypothetical protein